MNQTLDKNRVKLLTFRLGQQYYALDIMSVREIRAESPTTPLPHAPAYIKGVINLRGTVLAVMDLTSRLGLPAPVDEKRRVIIVINLNDNLTGLLVDAVSDIVNVTEHDLQLPPDSPQPETGTMITSLTLIDDRLVRILEIPRLFGAPEIAAA